MTGASRVLASIYLFMWMTVYVYIVCMADLFMWMTVYVYIVYMSDSFGKKLMSNKITMNESKY